MSSVPFERVVKRGQIYYIHKRPPYEGSRELHTKAGRPGIIVSRDDDNYMSGTVMVVYLTSSDNVRFQRETQFEIYKGKLMRSTAKCEQIDTVDKQCIGDYICDLSKEELLQLDRTLLLSLGFTDDNLDEIAWNRPTSSKEKEQHETEVKMLYARIKDLEAQNALLHQELDSRPSAEFANNEVRMYKKLYTDLLKTIAGKDI